MNGASLLEGERLKACVMKIVDMRIDSFSIAHGLLACNVKLLLSFTGTVNPGALRLDERLRLSERL
ncbi:hypothetical protein GA0004734_00021700 [Rhizobium sp. 9140]|nr:hypothetical protein GA0004734_00021700 [Rhizobium sp. 9140]